MSKHDLVSRLISGVLAAGSALYVIFLPELHMEGANWTERIALASLLVSLLLCLIHVTGYKLDRPFWRRVSMPPILWLPGLIGMTLVYFL